LPPYTVDALKIIFDAEVGNEVHGKGVNGRSTGIIRFANWQPRVFTTNALTVSEFFNILPRDLFSMDTVQLAALTADQEALLKRCAFCFVTASLLSGEQSDRYHKRRRQENSSNLTTYFSGVNALP
jgi:hypothetical protein